MTRSPRNNIRPLIMHGSSLTVAIPPDICKRLGWNRYDNIVLQVVEGHLMLSKIKLPSVDHLRDRAAAATPQE